MNNRSLFPAFLAIAVSVAMYSCNQPKGTTPAPDALVSHIDTTVRPGNDFFLYANGKWFKENPIPASEQSNGLWQLIDAPWMNHPQRDEAASRKAWQLQESMLLPMTSRCIGQVSVSILF